MYICSILRQKDRISQCCLQPYPVECRLYMLCKIELHFCVILREKEFPTADFIKKVLSVYNHSKTTIYLSLSAHVAKSTFFMKSPVPACFQRCSLGLRESREGSWFPKCSWDHKSTLPIIRFNPLLFFSSLFLYY